MSHAAQVRVLLNELLPAPTAGQQEWIELYNPADTAVSIAGWTIERTSSSSGARRTHTLDDVTLPPHGFALVSFESGFLINNGGTLALLNAQGHTIDSLDYPALSTEQGYARSSDGAAEWRNDYPLSPGQPNLPPTPAEPQPAAAEDADTPPAESYAPETVSYQDAQPAVRTTNVQPQPSQTTAPNHTVPSVSMFALQGGITCALAAVPGTAGPIVAPHQPGDYRSISSLAARRYERSGGQLYDYRIVPTDQEEPAARAASWPTSAPRSQPARAMPAAPDNTPNNGGYWLLAAALLLFALSGGCMFMAWRKR
jgi:hypothetical protein